MTDKSMESFYDAGWPEWYDMKEYGPASRHVRRIIFNLLKTVSFSSVMDAGCGVATLLNDISQVYTDVTLSGFEYSGDAVEIAKKRLPKGQFWQIDLSKEKPPAQADLVTCIDVLEHIVEDVAAMKNLWQITNKYVLIVVPLGPLFEAERVRVGHVHGYSQQEFDSKIVASGFKITKRIRWGFPFYNLYRRLLHILPESTVTGQYSLIKKLVSSLIYSLLFINLPIWGERYFLICEKVNE